MNHSLVLSESQHQRLSEHLHPGDGLESAAIILCHYGRGEGQLRLIANHFILIPADACEKRTPTRLTWPFADYFPPDKITEIDQNGLSVMTIHSHPGGMDRFSRVDNSNDKSLFHSICNWFDDDRPNGSAIILPDGKIVARLVTADGRFIPIHSVTAVGENIRIWKQTKKSPASLPAGLRIAQTFGKGTFDLLRNLRVGVVGCSGTGSIVSELLARNCIGTLILADPDYVEEKNLNRILNATKTDTKNKTPKASMLKRAIEKMGTGVQVEAYQTHTSDKALIEVLISCDVIFGCVDSAEGRYHIECIASAYWLPYFDVGVNLEANLEGRILQADAVAHYMHPENTSLMSRGGYTSNQVTAETWYRTDRKYYETQRDAGYLAAVGEDQPAVMSVNMQAACMAFNDFLARLHGFRLDCNDDFATQRFRLVHGHYSHAASEEQAPSVFDPHSGMGDHSFLIRKLKHNVD